MNVPSLYEETKYGCPTGWDQILHNNDFLVFYRNLYKQPLAVMQKLTPEFVEVERSDSFHEDKRIPKEYRAMLADYKGSGYDRGHLAPSAVHRGSVMENVDTFALSNMSPQLPKFNRSIWRDLETRIREHVSDTNDIYIVSGPIFLNESVKMCGTIPVPHMFFKSYLSFDSNGRVYIFAYLLRHENNAVVKTVPLQNVEKLCGFKLWSRLS